MDALERIATAERSEVDASFGADGKDEKQQTMPRGAANAVKPASGLLRCAPP